MLSVWRIVLPFEDLVEEGANENKGSLFTHLVFSKGLVSSFLKIISSCFSTKSNVTYFGK